MSMSKKNYEAIAAALKEVRGQITNDIQGGWDVPPLGAFARIVNALVDVFIEDNPRFRSETFRDAVYK